MNFRSQWRDMPRERAPSRSKMLDLLKKKGVSRAKFHPDGNLAEVEFSAPPEKEDPAETLRQALGYQPPPALAAAREAFRTLQVGEVPEA